MSLVTGSGAVAKIKNIKVTLTGFAGTSGMTSVFGAGSDINCPDVEYVSIGRPDTDENEETESDENSEYEEQSEEDPDNEQRENDRILSQLRCLDEGGK
jgi:hypothetical protein